MSVTSPTLLHYVCEYKVAVKYLIVGLSASSVHLIALFTLTDFAGLWYLHSAVLGYVAGFFTSFFFHKFWTFRDSSLKRIQKQFIIYLVMTVVNLILTTIFMYILVDLVVIWYMLAQVIVLGSLAILSFFVHKTITFKKIKVTRDIV